MRRVLLFFVCLGGLVFGSGCRVELERPGGDAEPMKDAERPQGTLWVYASLYPTVIEALTTLVGQELPGVDVQWFKGGSEKVASRLDAELAAGGSQADVLVISDPFTYARLADAGAFLPYVSPHVLRAPRELMDADGRFLPGRISTMVLAYRADVEDPPKSFRELTAARFRGQVALGDPLVSGTAFTWAVFQKRRYGPDFFRELRENGASVAGGNAAVQQRIESGEAKVGFLLLENALAAREKGSPLRFAYPEDGAVMIPGHMAILKRSRNPVAAKAFVDLLLSPQGQALIVRPGRMHAVDPRLEGPEGEPNLTALVTTAQPWSPDMLEEETRTAAQTKRAFSAAFAR